MIIFACKLIGLMSHHYLDELDKKILKLISEDARTPFLEVARACNVSGAAIPTCAETDDFRRTEGLTVCC